MALNARRKSFEQETAWPRAEVSARPVRSEAEIGRLPIGQLLASVQRSVETRFLSGGECLTGLMGVLEELTTSIGGLGAALAEINAANTTETLRAALSALQKRHAAGEARRPAIAELQAICAAMNGQAASLAETMRYLRTFAMTAKITGAGIADFAPFAVEIMEQISIGTHEVADFVTQLAALRKDLVEVDRVVLSSDESASETMPDLLNHLKSGLDRIDAYNASMQLAATRAAEGARRLQSHVGQGLTAMQIGDITRQRIEHVRAILEFGAVEPGTAIEAAAIDLAAAQLQDLSAAFRTDSARVINHIREAASEASHLLDARDHLLHQTSGETNAFYDVLDGHLEEAARVLAGLDVTEAQGNRVATSTAASAISLMDGISKVRSIRTDIFYMALNTNLRCSRLGEPGRAINVVTAELRTFAGHLEDTVEEMVHDLDRLGTAAKGLAASDGLTGGAFAQSLETARAAVHGTRLRVRDDAAAFAQAGAGALQAVEASLAALDFQSELGDMLESCEAQLADMCLQTNGMRTDSAAAAADALAPLFDLYTMEGERAIHRALLPSDALAAEDAAGSGGARGEDALFADALF